MHAFGATHMRSPAITTAPFALTDLPQWSRFTGIIPVFLSFLITIHWYWYVVYKVVCEQF